MYSKVRQAMQQGAHTISNIMQVADISVEDENLKAEIQEALDNACCCKNTSNLREMEAHGLVNRKVYAEVPPRVEYNLTELGQSLKPILDSLWTLGKHIRRVYKKGRLSAGHFTAPEESRLFALIYLTFYLSCFLF